MDKRHGKKTAHPGIRRMSTTSFLVRVTMTDPKERRQREKERLVEGELTHAIRAREDLREELRREMEEETKRSSALTQAAKETLSAYSQRWVEHLAKTGRNRVHVLETKVHMLNRFVLPTLGHLEVRKITRMDIVTWMENLADLRNDDKPYAQRTFAGAWGTLRTMLKDALVLCDLDKDPTVGIRFHVRGNEPAHKDVLTEEELAGVLAQTVHESPDIRAMIWLGFTTGMRFGELSALEWSDIDFERGLIHVRKSQVAGNVGPTKTRAHRSVPLHPTVAEVLLAHRRWQEERKVRGAATGIVFLSEVGGHRFSGVLTKPLLRCAEAASVKKHVTAHTMRRTFNNLARQAAGEIVARAMTGHTTTEMTEHYSHVSLAEKHRAVSAALGAIVVKPAASGVAPLGLAEKASDPRGVEA